MKNDLFTIGSITIHGYGLMIGIGIIYIKKQMLIDSRKTDVKQAFFFPFYICFTVLIL